MLATERLLRMELVVRATADAQVLTFVTSTERARDDVIELEERRRGATFTRAVDEGASFAVPLEHLAANLLRDVPRLRAGPPLLRALRLSQPLLLQLRNQQVDGLFDHDGEIPCRVGVAHQVGGA